MSETGDSFSESGQDSLSLLARLAKEGTTEEERQRAFGELIQPIKAIAAKVVSKHLSHKSTIGNDFIEEGPSLIWERLKSYDPAKRFKPWCAVVLNNALIDELRKQVRRDERVKSVSDLVNCAGEEGTQRYQLFLQNAGAPLEPLCEDDSFGEFSDQDIALLETELTAKARVVALVIIGLWVKVASQIWEQWLDEGDYPRDFPPDEIFTLDDIEERVTMVAEYLGETRPCIYMRWRRSIPILRRLSVFQR